MSLGVATDYDVTFTAPGGLVTHLDDLGSGFKILGPIEDGMMPDVTVDTIDPIDLPGDLEIGRKFGPRHITIPFAILAETVHDFRTISRAIVARMNPLAGDGTLRFDLPGATLGAREITARYESGLSGSTDATGWGTCWYETAVVFRCADPYYVDTADTVLSFATAASGTDFFPFATSPTDFGPHLGQSTIFDAFDVTNTGDGNAYPVWGLFGPAANPVFTNGTTGETLDLSANGGLILGPADSLRIDTRRRGTDLPVSVRAADGSNLFRYVADGSSLWAFARGANRCTLNVDGATAATRAVATFRQRYLAL